MKICLLKIFKIALVFLLFSVNLFTQEKSNQDYNRYDTLLKKAKISDLLKDYKLAEKHYDSAFLIVNYLFYDYFNFFQSAIKNSNY